MQTGVVQTEKWYKRKAMMCPFETCPYTELDGHKTYIDYLKSNDMDFNYNMPRWLYEEGGAE
jgi:hypothetical protein